MNWGHSEMEEKKKIEHQIRSNEVQEILSFIPHWLIRSGIGVILGTIIVLLVLTAFIKYPDVVKSRVTVITEIPPAPIIARTPGSISIFVEDNSYVEANEILGYVQNAANFEDVTFLKSNLQKFITTKLDSSESKFVFPGKMLALGEVQQSYSAFNQQFSSLNFFEENDIYAKRIKSLTAKITYYQQLNKKYKTQKALLENELKMALQKLENDRSLFEKGIISELTLNSSESSYLQKKFTLENTEISLLQNSLQLDELQGRILELKQDLSDKKRSLKSSLLESRKQLQSAIVTWEQRYVLKTPIAGNVAYFKVWSDNQFVNIGDEILTIIPNSTDLVGKVYVPLLGAGKIKEAQKVNVKLDSYPYKEYGMIEGKVEKVSQIPRDNMYVVDINFPNGFMGTYGDTLQFHQEMQGTAEIITEDLTLFERIFNQLRSLFQNV
ncbi:MAG: hypothetical protein ACJATA_000964 [Sphingobacteriales bacterium]